MKSSWIFLIFCLFPYAIIKSQNIDISQSKKMKVLVLIITSDQFPIYKELQKIWKSYMHKDPEHVEAYFIRGNPDLESMYEIKGDTIWSKTGEGWVPQSAGILNKTLLSMEAMLPRLHEFDYVIRTNLSSFYVFPRLLKFLETLPKEGCYCASPIWIPTIGSGCGFILSPDLIELLVSHKEKLFNHADWEDDVLIGRFLNQHGIGLIHHERMDFLSIEEWNQNHNKIPPHIFHFRLRNKNENLRIPEEIFIQSQLLRMFYYKSML